MSWLFLLSLVLHVSCQQFGSLPPRPTKGVRLFLGEKNVTIASFSMIAAGLFHDTDIDGPGNAVGVVGSPDGQNDGLWCQSSLNQNMIGTWYYPNGTTVLGSGSPLFADNTATGQIGLLRIGGIGNVQGLYRCVIPNEEGINQALYVAAYGNGNFLKDDEIPIVDGLNPSFQLLSSVDADPPVFSLSFNVTNRSPTIVTCSVDNGNQFNVSDNDLIRTVTPVNNDVQVQVSVIFRMRVSGQYKCFVTTDRIKATPLVSTNMTMRNVTVTGSPSNLTYSRDSLLSVTLGWSPSAVISATPQYHVFVNNSNGIIIMSNNTTNTELSLSLYPDDKYNIRLVATGEDLPSEIITVTVSQVVSIDVQRPVMMLLSSSFSLSCTLTIAPKVNVTVIDMFWANSNLNHFNSTTDGDIVLDALEPTMISVNDSVVYTLTLNFSSLQPSQVGEYVCGALLNDGAATNIISVASNYSIVVQVPTPSVIVEYNATGHLVDGELAEGQFLDIMFEFGQSLTITCTITTVERLVVTPMITFIKMNDTDMEMLSNLNRPYSITTDDTGSVTNYTLILDPVRFDDAGMYTCIAEFNVTGFNNTNDPSTATYDYQEANGNFILIFDIPPVIVTISKEHNDTLYAGTPFFIKCDIMLNPLVSIPVTVTNQWTRDGTNVPMGSSDATITEGLNMINSLHYNATLMFYPLDNADDSGMYTCNVEVNAPYSYKYLRNTSTNASTSIPVIATPVPVVQIVSMGIAEPGEEYMLNCTVTVVDGLIVSPVITWTKRSANNVISVPPVLMTVSNVMSSLYLNFSSLNTSDAGLYTCEASINVSQMSMVARNNESWNLRLKITIPFIYLHVSQSKESNLLAGSNLILTCDISVDPNVDTPFTVNVTWNMTDQQIMSNSNFGGEINSSSMLADTDRVNISSVMMRSGFNEYRSTLNFTTLSSIEDSGTYTCIVTIVPASAYEYVMTSDTNYTNIHFTVTDPIVGGLFASPNSFLGLETSCPDSDPYDNFTLTCTATKPTIVIPNLVIAWTHNGTIESGTVTTTGGNMTTTVTNTLSFDSSTASDSGTYRCTASITVPDSTDIVTTSEGITVTITSQSLPVPATNVTATPGTTTAAISFIIPNIAYTPEAYSVKYTGAILQTTQATSSIRMSSYDITAINQEFTIMLTGLEEDNTYTYTVDSTNCLGTTSTVEMSFRTLPALPVAPPMNCTNVTFLPYNVTLTWTAPPLMNQNGAPVGYNLTCMNTNGVSVNGLSPTRSSTNTMFTITDVMPFTGYTCELSFINVVGEGPSSTQCTFETAQSVPYNSPQNFTSIPDQTSVLFSWMEPTSTNGIIINYDLTVTNLDESKSMSFIIEVNPNQRFIDYNVDGFSPYQNYTASVSASTIIGAGPVATTAGRTLPDIPSSPHLVLSPVVINSLTVAYTVPVLNETTINITWSPPSHSNGEITEFIFGIATDAIDSPNNVSFVPGKASYSLIFEGLKERIPYYVSVVAVNQVGEGNPATAIVFTKADSSVTVSLSNVQAMRIGDTIVLSWDPVTLEEAKGFFVYSIKLTPDDDSTSSTLRQTNTRAISVAYDTTSVNITDTEPQLAYTVSISVLLLSDVGLIKGPAFHTSITMAPTNNSSTDNGSVPLLTVIVSTSLILIFFVVLVLMSITIVVLYRKNSKKFDISKDIELSVAPNPVYGLVTNTSTTQNNEDLYEKIDDYIYEPIDDRIVQQKEEDTPIVGDSGDNIISIAKCPVYDTITVPISSPNQGETNEEQDADVYEIMP
ncbi:PREDICTED: neogenin-like [Amphimedon queenslandica]|uniref:Protein-tyrosine-phosphatase n=1 Tax=Amphimedon queenslandica TaxID=400682 RepID=A0AAN0J2B0_AMPQE|nr:PREDICTED: neogenin-like [Amphimedon queenslandica]|eukprot:XP_019851145.1 PREDICTED: neogenin-like [Amphimedon queenslandica]